MRSSYLKGLWTKKNEVAVSPKTEVCAIRFKPLAAEYIIQQKIANLLNAVIKIPDFKYPLFKQLDSRYQDFDSLLDSNTFIHYYAF